MTKWDILKITPLRIDCMIACLVPVIYPSCPLPVTPPSPTPPPLNLELNPEALHLVLQLF